jgi:hypothetical protein
MSTSCQGEATSEKEKEREGRERGERGGGERERELVTAADDSEDISERHGGRKLLLMSDDPTFPLSSASPNAEEFRLNDSLSETAISHVTVATVLQGWTSGASTFGEEDGGVSRDAGCLVLPRFSTH